MVEAKLNPIAHADALPIVNSLAASSDTLGLMFLPTPPEAVATVT
jgi:hypothetical protein